ncbi:MAG: hypothetical protein R3B72_38940 [Polyangiaceae bacterium]
MMFPGRPLLAMGATLVCGGIGCGSSVALDAATGGGGAAAATGGTSVSSSNSGGGAARGVGGAGAGGAGGAGGSASITDVPSYATAVCPDVTDGAIACVAFAAGEQAVVAVDPFTGDRCDLTTVTAPVSLDDVWSFTWEGFTLYACDRNSDDMANMARFDVTDGTGERGGPENCVSAVGWREGLVLGLLGLTPYAFDQPSDAFDLLPGEALGMLPLHVYNGAVGDTFYAFDSSDEHVKRYALPALTLLGDAFENAALHPFTPLEDGRVITTGLGAITILDASGVAVNGPVAVTWVPRAIRCWIP